MEKRIETAVVLGGSLSGALTAAVLARFAERVIVIERDALFGPVEPRKGVPQARHNHNLAPSGLAFLERIYPGLKAELAAAGANVVDIGARGTWAVRGRRFARTDVGAEAAFMARPLLDAAVLRRTTALGNVELRDRTDVLGLVVDDLRQRVTGVRVLARDAERADELLAADLVIDASGRGSRVPAWLSAADLPAPRDEALEVRVAYVTRLFRRVPDATGDRYIFVAGVAPDEPRGGVAFAIDGDRWMVLLFGYGGTKPPTDLPAFIDYARGLAVPDLAELVSGLEPLSDAATFSYPRALRRRYDELRDPLAGLLVIGDALMSTNPSYGIGMTALTRQAVALETCLERGTRGLERRYFAAAVRASASIWNLTTGSDRAYACVSGASDARPPAIARYLAAVCDAAAFDPEVARAMLKVANFVASPLAVLNPWIALRVFSAQRRERAGLARKRASRMLGT